MKLQLLIHFLESNSLISPVKKVNSLSSAASKSYRALTLRGSLGFGFALLDDAAIFIDGYREELWLIPEVIVSLGEPESFNDNSIALSI